MSRPPDPASMTPQDRLAELGIALANAYLRLRARRGESQKALADHAESTAPCGQPVNAAETAAAKESE